MKKRAIVSRIFGIALVFVMVGTMLISVSAGGEETSDANQVNIRAITYFSNSESSGHLNAYADLQIEEKYIESTADHIMVPDMKAANNAVNYSGDANGNVSITLQSNEIVDGNTTKPYDVENQDTAYEVYKDGDLREIKLPHSGGQPKSYPDLESILGELVRLQLEEGHLTVSEFSSQRNIDVIDSKVKVIVEANPGQYEAACEAISGLGAEIEASYEYLFRALIPISDLTVLAENPAVRFVRLPRKPFPMEETSEGVSVIGADDWRLAGWTGDGVKIGIIDVGFAGHGDLMIEGELPNSLFSHWFGSGGTEGDSNHGSACAEIIHDIAPNAALYLTNYDDELDWANAIDYLISNEVDIISASVGHPSWGPGDGTGLFCEKVADAKYAGILWVNAAGNYGDSHWMGPWADSNGNSLLNFAPSSDTNVIEVLDGQKLDICLKWDDTWGESDNDYDLYLLDDSMTDAVAAGDNTQNGDDDPLEIIQYTAKYTGQYHIIVESESADNTANFHLYAVGVNPNTSLDMEYWEASESLCSPADSPHAMTVGAVDSDFGILLMDYSSQGPTDDGRTKPDVVAPTGVTTASIANFGGTSAACPHAAGAAALVKEAFPIYGPAEIQAYLEGHAFDMGDPGKDNEYGAGSLRLDTTPPTVINHHNGSNPNTNIYVTFSEDMDDSTFNNTNITVSGSLSGSHSCTFSFSHSTHELTINPVTDFAYDETVTVTIGTGVKDFVGNGLATAYVFDFPIVPYVHDTNITISFSQDPVDIFHIVTITAEVIDDNTGLPIADTIVMFSSSLSGWFTNSNIAVPGHPSWAETNGSGIATIDWEPQVAGTAIITAEVEGFTPAQKPLTVNNVGIDIALFLAENTRTDTSTKYEIKAIVTLDDGTPVVDWICFDSPDIPLDECMETSYSGEATTDITICVNGDIQICAEILGFRQCATFAVSCGPIPEIPVFETLDVRSRAGLAWSGDGRILAGVGRSPLTVQLYNFMTQSSSESGMLRDGKEIYSMRANDAGDKVAVGQSGGYLSTVDLATGTVTGPYDTGLSRLWSLDWQGSDIIVGASNGDIGSYTPAWSENWKITTSDAEHILALRCDGSSKFTAGDDIGNLFLRSSSNGAHLDKETAIGGDTMYEFDDTAWSPSGAQVAATGDGFAYVYTVSGNSLTGKTALTGFQYGRNVYSVEYVLNRDGVSIIVTGCTWVNYYSTSGGSATAITHAGDAYSLAWNPVYRILAVGTGTQTKLVNLSDDLLPPNVSVIPGSVTVPYGTDSMVLEITLEDASFLRELTVEVNGVPVPGIPPIPPEQYSASRDVEVDLDIGPNAITVKAWDLYRNESTTPITITRQDDTTGPMISDVIVSPSIGDLNDTFTISANITDEMPIGDVEAYIQDIGESDIAVLTMMDDGTGGDVTAGDHNYTALWDSTGAPSGPYLLDIHAEDTHLPPNETYLDNCALFEVKGPTPVDISVVLQGGSRPPEAWEVPITIKFFEPGADVTTGSPLYVFNLTTTKSDGIATCQCAGVMPDNYDITTVSEHTLINVKRNVVISTPSTAVNMGTLLEGNANNDGIINISDFGILAVSYMCTIGEPCYDCRADFDCNGIINISDFGLLAVNYMQMSPIDVS